MAQAVPGFNIKNFTLIFIDLDFVVLREIIIDNNTILKRGMRNE